MGNFFNKVSWPTVVVTVVIVYVILMVFGRRA